MGFEGIMSVTGNCHPRNFCQIALREDRRDGILYGLNAHGGIKMKRRMLALFLAALMLLLCGCGMILVEDSEPVIVGNTQCVRMFT